MRYVRVEKSGAVSTVVLDRPERLNAISGDLLDDLHQALVEVNADEGCKVIVFTGEGRAFCAGDDLKEFGKQTESDASIRSHVERIQQITRDLMFNGKPVIGAVHGFAVGGGFEWLLNCDLVVASDDLVCFFPEMAWGQFVTGGVTQLLPQSVGHQRAMELWLLGERQSAQQLYSLGLVNRVIERDKVLETARELATRVSERSAFSVSRLKRLLTTELSTDLGRSLELEQVATVAAFATPEAARRVQAFATRK
ncbi:TPA: enoyl-CoA hydratase/isomerase family protein [Burkholderia aenigmatica]|uniref:enoyl-CoA hydratase/isomerase family protein n=1 Tax=Burkholderia sp. AU45251 TaxID=3059204 RepID=UPI00264E40BB|nr:enoyl-CoA hydratase/isomerase family protein [Burkholderia sp. AU45251]HDR9482392.1 enoyl-CoA hydratase/isomerase family protein [Burkholderia aenigmatica]MDN7514969.1 enoyl-CoA hydratase/isomerase family protein [Burkholderia sp. AU45251]HDR9514698.1 enoyl-CoA hydratase/isomerase family protein [Burkholderia aenigmatica]HDR9590763.1 enoyl-CoA hydratase/isomerase family protein [Burkholderia aenigmatica]HDR9599919.1 enoyl-CoA hydratase/isomerase family protein [Burkholderia aenigmatica]